MTRRQWRACVLTAFIAAEGVTMYTHWDRCRAVARSVYLTMWQMLPGTEGTIDQKYLRED